MDAARLKVSVDTSEMERAIALADEYIGKLERIAEMESSRSDELPPFDLRVFTPKAKAEMDAPVNPYPGYYGPAEIRVVKRDPHCRDDTESYGDAG